MHLTQSNPPYFDTFELDDSNLTQSNSNSWIQTGPNSLLEYNSYMAVFKNKVLTRVNLAKSKGSRFYFTSRAVQFFNQICTLASTRVWTLSQTSLPYYTARWGMLFFCINSEINLFVEAGNSENIFLFYFENSFKSLNIVQQTKKVKNFYTRVVLN